MHCVSIRSIAFKSFKTWFWNLSLSIESVDYGVWSVVPLCRSSSKRDCSNLYEIGTWCFDNINEGSDYIPLQSCLSVERSTGSLGVIGNAELFWLRVLWGGGEGSGGGRGEEEGEIKSPQVKKKRRNISSRRFLSLPSFSLTNGFHFVVHLFNKTLQMLQVRKGSTRCAAVSYPLLKENRSLFLLWVTWHWACHVDVINGLQ